MTEAEVVDRLVEYLNVLIAGISVFFTIVSAYGFREFLAHGGPGVRADPTRIAR